MTDGTDESPEQLRAKLADLFREYRELWGEDAAAMWRSDVAKVLLQSPTKAPTKKIESAPAVPKPASPTASSDAPKDFPKIIGRSSKMKKVFELVRKIAPTDVTVLIQGESGTGKELVARAIHDHSQRSQKAYVAENCAAFPETLLESELFGHTRGSFTGADRNRVGRFKAADGGTLFLDEVGDMSHSLQKKLLRALQEGEVRPVGANQSIRVNVRFLSASNKSLVDLVQKGLFREDLYYRLTPVSIELPPLRERQGDVPLLVRSLSSEIASQMGREPPIFSEEAMAALEGYHWPGNVRELQNELQRALALADPSRPVTEVDLSDSLRNAS